MKTTLDDDVTMAYYGQIDLKRSKFLPQKNAFLFFRLISEQFKFKS